jgi:hypothetical protein
MFVIKVRVEEEKEISTNDEREVTKKERQKNPGTKRGVLVL